MAKIIQLRGILNNADEHDIITCLDQLRRDALLSFPNGFTAEEALPKYVAILMAEKMGIGPIRKVKARLLRGEYEGFGRFMPTPPEYVALCRREHEYLRSKINELKTADRRRPIIANRLPLEWTNRQREDEIDRILAEEDGVILIEAAQ